MDSHALQLYGWLFGCTEHPFYDTLSPQVREGTGRLVASFYDDRMDQASFRAGWKDEALEVTQTVKTSFMAEAHRQLTGCLSPAQVASLPSALVNRASSLLTSYPSLPVEPLHRQRDRWLRDVVGVLREAAAVE